MRMVGEASPINDHDVNNHCNGWLMMLIDNDNGYVQDNGYGLWVVTDGWVIDGWLLPLILVV